MVCSGHASGMPRCRQVDGTRLIIELLSDALMLAGNIASSLIELPNSRPDSKH